MVTSSLGSRERVVGSVALVTGIVLLSVLPAIYSTGDGHRYNHLLIEALLASFLAPMLVVWGTFTVRSNTFRPLTIATVLPVPVIAWGTYAYTDQLAPNLWVIDTVVSGTFRDPSVVDSLVWVLTGGMGLFVAALCCAIVGVVLARHGRRAAAWSGLVPLAVAMVYPATTGDVEDAILYPTAVAMLAWLPFAFGYFAAADRDEDAEPISRWLPGVAARVGADGNAE